MIIVNRIEEHEKHKASLLAKIESLKVEIMPGVYSDWKGDDTHKEERTYLDEFYSLLDPVMEGVARAVGFITPPYVIRDYRYEVRTAWFNQYLEGGEHEWHNHRGCQFTNCYYLELPDEEYKTEVVGIDGKLIEYTVKEGDVMTCPAWMKHRSKPNGPLRKTIIAFNSNYEV